MVKSNALANQTQPKPTNAHARYKTPVKRRIFRRADCDFGVATGNERWNQEMEWPLSVGEALGITREKQPIFTVREKYQGFLLVM